MGLAPSSITIPNLYKNLNKAIELDPESALTHYITAMAALARVWARELGPDNITVNAVSPGAFQTDAEKIHPDPEGYNRFVLDQQALKRRGTPADFANLVMFLMSDAASFISGQNIRVDGGWVTA